MGISKKNCWEFKKCGREIGGVNAAKDGVCPAACNTEADGFCDGKNGGRACVYVIGTLCDGECRQAYESKEKLCGKCEFYLQLKKEYPDGMTIFSYVDYMIKHNKGGSAGDK